jgi:hypothetical protein
MTADLHKRVSRRLAAFLSNAKSADRLAAEIIQMCAASVDGRRMAETAKAGSVRSTTSAVPHEDAGDAQ